ncbi:MAG: endonuclease domain-containing protein [Oscillochloridaceae bacterium umkhey_bin13]
MSDPTANQRTDHPAESATRLVVNIERRRNTRERARSLRNAPTRSEAQLWQAVRRCQVAGYRFRRQQPLGPFIVDFFCPAARLVIEVDGPIHADQEEADQERQRIIEAAGYRVVRIPSLLVEQHIDQALQIIHAALVADQPPVTGSLASPAAERAFE